MPAIGKSVTKTIKGIGKSSAKRVLQESLEVLKESKKQVLSDENEPQPEVRNDITNRDQKDGLPEDYEKMVKTRDKQRLEQLDRRIQDIRRQKLVEDLQKRISGGEDVSLVDYPELGWEQRQVLQAQMQAVKARKMQAIRARDGGVIEPEPKRKRGLFRGRGMKSRAEKLKRKSEIRMSPSG